LDDQSGEVGDWSSGTDATHVGTGPSWWDVCPAHTINTLGGQVSAMPYPVRK
jgi:hypothetical protein